MCKRVAIAVAWMLALVAQGVAGTEQFRDWTITVDRDRFSDAANATLVTTRGTSAFALRCLDGKLSLAILELDNADRYPAGRKLTLLLRVDRNKPIATQARAISDTLAEIYLLETDAVDVIKQIAAGQEIAVRIANDVMEYDRVFRLQGAQRVVPPLLKICKVS